MMAAPEVISHCQKHPSGGTSPQQSRGHQAPAQQVLLHGAQPRLPEQEEQQGQSAQGDSEDEILQEFRKYFERG